MSTLHCLAPAALAFTLLPLALLAHDVPPEVQALELEKLRLELLQLKQDTGPAQWLRFILSTLFLPVVVAWFGFIIARQQKKTDNRMTAAAEAAKAEAEKAALRFTALTEARTAAYAKAFALTEATALTFPRRPEGAGEDTPVLTPARCAEMGRGLSGWYFGAGGLLLTEGTRRAYEHLMEALASAARSTGPLASASFAAHGTMLSDSEIRATRAKLRLGDRMPEGWAFGTGDGAEPNRDFVLIQTLASRFRTALTRDIASRAMPEVADEAVA
ncbi:hypothetical protein [Vannielia sp. SX4]|uniref:hypothetical protein n=1 Tax=Vannielia sp. SX4 TaxID=3463852 RepID=UPI004059624E